MEFIRGCRNLQDGNVIDLIMPDDPGFVLGLISQGDLDGIGVSMVI